VHRLYPKTCAAIAYTAVAIALTWPLVLHVADRVPHDLGDPLLSVAILRWNARHLPLTAAWWNAPFYYPAAGALTFSDHRLGESLIASPLQWIGLGPLAAYNVTLLATFPLCALAAHALGFTLTRRHDAAAIAGLAYGFSPYRFAHIEHLELLAAFGMPLALLALHRFWTERRPWWLIAFAGALLLQALLCSYYFLFFGVLAALWVLWFARRGNAGLLAGAAAAIGAAGLVLMPLASTYFSVHERYGLVRHPDEIVSLGADVTSLVTASPLSAIWGWTSTLNGSERQLFPGACILALVVLGIVGALRRSRPRFAVSRVPVALAVAAALAAATAVRALRRGRFGASTASAYLLAAAVLWSSPVRDAYRRRSLFAFYVLAAAALFVFALGPEPTFLHRTFMTAAPYAWLMRLSVFREQIRVPARFGMPAVLALAVAGAIAFDRLTTGRRRVSLAAVLGLAIVADASIAALPLLEPPHTWPAQIATDRIAAFVELPLGDTLPDAAAMYRSALSGLPTANGYSGYVPPHYEVLRFALDEFDATALEALASNGPLLVSADRRQPSGVEWIRRLRSAPPAHETAQTADAVWFTIDSPRRPGPACAAPALAIASIRDRFGDVAVAPLQDGNGDTAWRSAAGQRSGDALIVDLGRAAQPCSVRMALGPHAAEYPRALRVSTSIDGRAWTTSFAGPLGGEAVLAAVAHPRNAVIELPLGAAPARFVRLELTADRPNVTWTVAELHVTGARP